MRELTEKIKREVGIKNKEEEDVLLNVILYLKLHDLLLTEAKSEVKVEAEVMLRRITELKMADKEIKLLEFCIENFKSEDATKRIIGFIDGKLEILEQFIKLETMFKRIAT